MKKAILWLVGILALGGIIYWIFFTPSNGSGLPSSTSVSFNPILTGETVNASEFILCVSKKVSDGKCLIGMEDTKGSDYVLLDSTDQPVNPDNYTTGQNIVISGSVATEASLQKDYKVAGVVVLK
jgi:hypothetical protein